MNRKAKVKSIYNSKTTQAILSVVAVAGVLTIATVAPGTLHFLGYVLKDKRQRNNRHYYINSVVGKLVDKGLLVYSKNDQGQKVVRLTSSGEKVLEKYQPIIFSPKKPNRWDGKYHIIIFDIKEWKRGVRDELRRWLQGAGFVLLQQSVWVYPYDCREIIVLLKARFKIGKEVLYLTADYLENDRWLKEQFGLKN